MATARRKRPAAIIPKWQQQLAQLMSTDRGRISREISAAVVPFGRDQTERLLDAAEFDPAAMARLACRDNIADATAVLLDLLTPHLRSTRDLPVGVARLPAGDLKRWRAFVMFGATEGSDSLPARLALALCGESPASWGEMTLEERAAWLLSKLWARP